MVDVQKLSGQHIFSALQLFCETVADDWLVKAEDLLEQVCDEFFDQEAEVFGITKNREVIAAVNLLPWHRVIRPLKLDFVQQLSSYLEGEKLLEPGWVGGLTVRPDFRRQGLAKLLLKKAEESAKLQLGADCLLAVTAKCNKDLQWPAAYAAASRLGLWEIPAELQPGDRISNDLVKVWLCKDI